jgi:hypothetical protein
MKKYGYSAWFLTMYFLSLPGTFVIVFLTANILSGYYEPEGQSFIMIFMLGVWTIGAVLGLIYLITFKITISADSIGIGTILKKKVIPIDRMKGYAENKMDGKDDSANLSLHTQKWLTILYIDSAAREQKERIRLDYFHKYEDLKEELTKALYAKKIYAIIPPLPPMV